MERDYEVKWRSNGDHNVHTMTFRAENESMAVLKAQKWDSRFGQLVSVRAK